MEKSKHTKSIILKISIFLLCCLTIAAAFFLAYNYIFKRTDNAFLDKVAVQVTALNDANLAAANIVEGLGTASIEDETIISNINHQLYSSSKSIQGVTSKLEDITVPSRYADDISALIEGTKENKKVYDQTVLILKNTKSPKLEDAITSLGNYIDKSVQNYSSVNLAHIQVTLPNNILMINDTVHQYAFRAYNDYEAKNREIELYTAYYTAMDTVVRGLQSNLEDFSSSIILIKNNVRSAADIYSKIDKKLIALYDLKDSYSKISLPPKVVTSHKKFGSFLDQYISYCRSYKNAISSLSDSDNTEETLLSISSNLDKLSADFKKLISSYSAYTDTFYNDMDIYTSL